MQTWIRCFEWYEVPERLWQLTTKNKGRAIRLRQRPQCMVLAKRRSLVQFGMPFHSLSMCTALENLCVVGQTFRVLSACSLSVQTKVEGYANADLAKWVA